MPPLRNREEYEQWKSERLKRQSESELQTRFKKRPGLVLAVGWGFILLAILMILSGLSGISSSALIREAGGQISPLEDEFRDFPLLFRVFLFGIRYSAPLSALVTFIAIGVLAAGIYFMRLKSWAKTVLEIFSWASLLVIGALGLLWASVWIDNGNASAAPAAAGLTVGFVIMLFYAAVPVTALVVLRHKSVRRAFGSP